MSNYPKWMLKAFEVVPGFKQTVEDYVNQAGEYDTESLDDDWDGFAYGEDEYNYEVYGDDDDII